MSEAATEGMRLSYGASLKFSQMEDYHLQDGAVSFKRF